MKVYYHNDLDGRCAAAIHWKYYKDAPSFESIKYIEMDYKDFVNSAYIDSNEDIFILDFSFKPDVMKDVLRITHNIVWCDHHKTAFEYDYGYNLKGLRNINLSGCELTWKYLFPSVPVSMGVQLIGDYDLWTFRFVNKTEYFQLGLQTFDTNPKSYIWQRYIFSLNVEDLEKVINKGVACEQFRNNFCKDNATSYGFETNFEGYCAFAIGVYEFGSKLFGDLIYKYPLCLSFVFDGTNWTIGLYSETIDVSEIAKKYGGGGHKGAAGFVCKELPFKK